MKVVIINADVAELAAMNTTATGGGSRECEMA